MYTVEALVENLEKRFAPDRDSSYCSNEINDACMERDETIAGFYDRLKIILEGTKHAL